jgi:hypothetical protein
MSIGFVGHRWSDPKSEAGPFRRTEYFEPPRKSKESAAGEPWMSSGACTSQCECEIRLQIRRSSVKTGLKKWSGKLRISSLTQGKLPARYNQEVTEKENPKKTRDPPHWKAYIPGKSVVVVEPPNSHPTYRIFVKN